MSGIGKGFGRKKSYCRFPIVISHRCGIMVYDELKIFFDYKEYSTRREEPRRRVCGTNLAIPYHNDVCRMPLDPLPGNLDCNDDRWGLDFLGC